MFLFGGLSVQVISIAGQSHVFGGVCFHAVAVVVLDDVTAHTHIPATCLQEFHHHSAAGVAFDQATRNGNVVGSGQQEAEPCVPSDFTAFDDGIGTVRQGQSASGKRSVESAVADANSFDISEQ